MTSTTDTQAARVVVISPSGLESPPERAYVIALNELMRLRARFGAPPGRWLTAPALARIALFGGLRGRPWRLSPDAGVRDLHDFGYSPGFQSTLRSTVAPLGMRPLAEIFTCTLEPLLPCALTPPTTTLPCAMA